MISIWLLQLIFRDIEAVFTAFQFHASGCAYTPLHHSQLVPIGHRQILGHVTCTVSQTAGVMHP